MVHSAVKIWFSKAFLTHFEMSRCIKKPLIAGPSYCNSTRISDPPTGEPGPRSQHLCLPGRAGVTPPEIVRYQVPNFIICENGCNFKASAEIWNCFGYLDPNQIISTGTVFSF